MYCFPCRGTGKVTIKTLCKSCMGSGRKDYGPGMSKSCELCKGEGYQKKIEDCTDCDGTGDTDNKKPWSL